MKTTLIFLLLSFTIFAQSPPMINVWRITPTVVCVGDSFKVDYKVSPPIPAIASNTLTFVYLNSPNDTLFKGDYKLMEKNKKEHYTGLNVGDSTYYVWYKMSLRSPGTYSVLTLSNSSYVNEIAVASCNFVGIEEQYKEVEKPVYFDFNGNQIERRANELIIEQVGLKRRKIVVLER